VAEATREQLLEECARLREIIATQIDSAGRQGMLVDFTLGSVSGVEALRVVICAPSSEDEMRVGDAIALALATHLRDAGAEQLVLDAIADVIERGIGTRDPKVLLERTQIGSRAERPNEIDLGPYALIRTGNASRSTGRPFVVLHVPGGREHEIEVNERGLARAAEMLKGNPPLVQLVLREVPHG